MRGAAAALAGLALLAAGAPAGAERLLRFETQLRLAADGSFEVAERLRVDFGAERRHGIFRDVPVAYGRGRAADYRIRVEVRGVTDELGAPRPWEADRRGRDLRIRIGDPERTVSGVQHYVLRYRVERGILWFERHDELYWNATGTGWAMPIEEARARVELPEALAPDAVETACYTGALGSVASACRVRATPGVVSFETEGRLGPGEGLSLVVGLPKGVLEEPSRLRRLLARASDWLSAWLLLPLAALAAMGTMWRREGRDPAAADALPVRYEPPEGMTPAEVGTVLDESVDRTDLTATILELAVQGRLRIEEEEGTRFLFLSTKDYVLHRTGDATDLPPFEAALHARLFEDGDVVRVSSLRNRFHRHLP
ncbi:MAG: DUF2207 domain-containing protein, partial [Myxococcota bacterium]|nr:DUF2207 domain-containing protein [Myxococcota bacterium]